MNFQDVAARFERAESGSDSFKTLFRDAFDQMRIDADNAGLYFVIGIAAQSYVRRYEDQGVDPEFADKAKAILVGYNTKLVQALASDATTRLRLLGEVAIDYEWHQPDF
jgi:Tat protein secretion system quality control protein TatD with DNase activity